MCEQLKTAVLVPQLTHLDELLSAVEGVTEALKQEPVARLLDQATGGEKKTQHLSQIIANIPVTFYRLEKSNPLTSEFRATLLTRHQR